MNRARIFLVAGAAVVLAAAAPVHDFLAVTISPDGKRVASIEGDEDPAGEAAVKSLVIRSVAGGEALTLKLPCGVTRECTPVSPAWAPDSTHLSFLLRQPGTHAYSIYTADAATGTLTQRLTFDGTLDDLRYGPGGRLAVLAAEGASKEVGAVEAGAAQTGVLGADVHEQRVAVLGDDSKLHFASPADLFVYEYDWRPDGRGFVGTAAPGDGDAHWWVAKLYAFDAADAKADLIYAPASPQEQLAQPKASPDGRSVSFIGGLMSDFGATGGEAYVLSLGQPDAKPVDVTPHWPATTGICSPPSFMPTRPSLSRYRPSPPPPCRSRSIRRRMQWRPCRMRMAPFLSPAAANCPRPCINPSPGHRRSKWARLAPGTT
jgi:hypothetical protein